jgi:urease beta subunit
MKAVSVFLDVRKKSFYSLRIENKILLTILFFIVFISIANVAMCQVIKEGHGSQTQNDSTYGKGGKKITNYDTTLDIKMNIKICIKIKYIDSSGTVRKTTDTCRTIKFNPGIAFKNCDEIYIGPSTIFEDNNPDRFNTFGGNIAYTHPLISRLGITGDAGFYFGSNKGFDYTKLQVLIGVSILPVNNSQNEFSFSPHLLAGISNVSSKYKTDMTSYSNSSTGFSLAAGTDISYSLNNKTGITARLDYNPTISTGGVKNNFRLGLGIQFSPWCHGLKKKPGDFTFVFAGLTLINPGLVQMDGQPEVLTGKCHDPKDSEEPGPETVITVMNESYPEKIIAPKNVGTCPIEIFCVDAEGKKIPGTSIFLEPGEGIEGYTPPLIPIPPKPPIVIPPFPPIADPNNRLTFRVARVVFQCNSRKDGECKLQMDHWGQGYQIPRGKIKGICNNKNISVGPIRSGSLNWIKNTGTCPVELFSWCDGKALDKPTQIAPGAILPAYHPRIDLFRGSDSVLFRCPSNNKGTCEIELDSSATHHFPIPEGYTEGATPVYMVLKGECDGKESTISMTNGKKIRYYGLKNLGTCPLEIYERDELDNKSFGMEETTDANGSTQVVPRTTALTLEPGAEASTIFITSGFGNRVVLKCNNKKDGDNCSLQIFDRIVEYLVPVKDPHYEPKFKPARSVIRGECSADADEKKLICFLGGSDDNPIKWITNTGDCPLEIFSTLLNGSVPESSRIRLEPGQTIESYSPPQKSLAVYFRCSGKSQNGGTSCSLEFEHPESH